MIDDTDLAGFDWRDTIYPPSTSTFNTPITISTPLKSLNLANPSYDFATSPELPRLQNSRPFIFSDDNSTTEASEAQSYNTFEHFTGSSSPPPKQEPLPPPSICTPKLPAQYFEVGPQPVSQRSDFPIDQLLAENKAQLQNAFNLLSHSCPDTPHYALTIALTCVRNLAHCEAVLQAPQPSRYAEKTRIQIVVNELRKVKGLVDRYANKYCCHHPGRKGDGHDGGIYGALEVFLRSELAMAMQDLLMRVQS
ncbi:uncharacterized protein L3040_005982 [Drepanopeziza brunnea f. sp. 'multigermtubi']|nr:hypothetical protein L3040_005982 [Drepanopeziza brunnea f. sp. 'multigermtubi']